ncbi:hypothetical protein, partial [Salinibacter altiplanensis]|uniref:hypothetical protein n=1 Tax=Salinibacter altiplanensis TaxID=1803181 RepID=UPI00131A5467
MEKYASYNLLINSDIELPVYPEAPDIDNRNQIPIVEIKEKEIDKRNLSYHNNNGDFLAGVADNTLLFHVKEGNTILFDPLPGADKHFIQAVVGGELMAALLRQRGILPLHASCVSKQGQSVAFVGDSGWGKSTLAMLFAKEGYTLVADDILALDLSGKHPVVHPSPPYIRLHSDTGNKFISGYKKLPTSHSRTSKRHVTLKSLFTNTETQLKKIYFLEQIGRNENSVEPIDPSLATVKLINHTRAKRLT